MEEKDISEQKGKMSSNNLIMDDCISIECSLLYESPCIRFQFFVILA